MPVFAKFGRYAMSVNTKNSYGQINISDEAIAVVANQAARDCYGVVDMVPRKISDFIADLFHVQTKARGVRIETVGNRIFIDLYVIIKNGVSISAVAESLKEAVKYSVEHFSGMIVDTVNVNVEGIKI